MFKIEKRFLEWVEKHILLFCVIGVTLISMIIRYSFREIISNDAYWCLLPWYDVIKENGGIYALGSQVGDYNMLYQFIIAVFTYLPIEPLSAYKLLSCIFDYLLAAAMGYFVYFFSEKDRILKGTMAYMLVLMSPIVILNSSYWGQCDAIYTFFCVASLLAFCRDKYKLTFVLYGVAFAFKLQAVFLLPFFLFAYFVKKKFSVLYFGIIPVMMVILSIPGLIMGRSVAEVFTIYLNQTGSYKSITMNYPTFWNLLQSANMDAFYINMKKPAIALTVVVIALLMVTWIVKKVPMTTRNMIYMAFLLAYTCVLILPSMHERYGYLYEILAILVAFLQIRTLPCLVGMYLASFAIYGKYLFMFEINLPALSIVNTLAYIGYIVILTREMLKDGERAECIE